MATAATVISAVAGSALALGLREVARRSRAVNMLLQIPLAVPHLAMAGALISDRAAAGVVGALAFAGRIIRQQPADFPGTDQ